MVNLKCDPERHAYFSLFQGEQTGGPDPEPRYSGSAISCSSVPPA